MGSKLPPYLCFDFLLHPQNLINANLKAVCTVYMYHVYALVLGSRYCLTLSAAAVCHSLDTCNAPTPHRTIAVLYKPALWVLPMIGDGGLAVPDNPG